MQEPWPTGGCRAIGVSNFKPSHLDRLIQETGVAPHVNQIQLDPGSAELPSAPITPSTTS